MQRLDSGKVSVKRDGLRLYFCQNARAFVSLFQCRGQLKVIASIEDPAVIAQILAHLHRTSVAPEPELAPLAARAPPIQSVLL